MKRKMNLPSNIKAPNDLFNEIIDDRINTNSKYVWAFMYIAFATHNKLQREDRTYQFTIEDMRETFELEGNNGNRTNLVNRLKDSAKNLTIQYEDDYVFEIVSVFERIRIDKENGTTTIKLTPTMVETVSNLNTHWFELNRKELVLHLNNEYKFKSTKSFNFYMFLNATSNRKLDNYVTTVDRDKLYSILGVWRDEKPTHIEKRVLDVIQEDLLTNKLGTMKYKRVKKGRTVVAWNFTFVRFKKTQNSTYKKIDLPNRGNDKIGTIALEDILSK